MFVDILTHYILGETCYMAKDNWSAGERNRLHFHLGVREKTSLRHLINELGVRE